MDIMRAKDYDGREVTNWLMSEKLDGCWARWTGSTTMQLMSKTGKVFVAPDWFLSDLPAGVTLDGELFKGRNTFQQLVSTVRKKAPVDDEWKNVIFSVFDAPSSWAPVENRIEYYLLALEGCKYATGIRHSVCESNEHAFDTYERIIRDGGEGVMFRRPGAFYIAGESDNILRLKPVYTDEAVVVGYTEGKGKNQGLVGAMLCQWCDHTFRLNASSDEMRRNPPPVGSVITFKYRSLTDAGLPRLPTFVIERDYE